MAAQTGSSGSRASHLPRMTTPLAYNTSNYHGLIRHEFDGCPPYGATGPLSTAGAVESIALYPPGGVDFREVTSPALRSVADSSSMLQRPGVRWHKTSSETSRLRHQSQQQQQQHQTNAVAIDDGARFGSSFASDYVSVAHRVATPSEMPLQQFQQQQQPLYGSAHVPMTRMRQTAVAYGTVRAQQHQKSSVDVGGSIRTPTSTPTAHPLSSSVAKASFTGSKMSANQYLASSTGSPEYSSFLSSASSQQLYSVKSQSAPRTPGAACDKMTSGRRQFPTNFAALMTSPSLLPASLSARATHSGVLPTQHVGKIKVVLRVAGVEPNTDTCLTVASDRRQVVVHDPSSMAAASTSSLYRQRASCTVPRLFAFDNIFTPADSLADLCSGCLDDALQSVLGGSDSCVFSFGPSRLGKTYTMIGLDDSNPKELGVIPSAISWLFQMIGQRREQTGARFSVRVSAVELTGRNEQLKDLLCNVSTSTLPAPATVDVVGLTSSGPVTRDDGLQLNNVSEIRAPSAESAAFLLDAAIAARTVPDTEEDAKHSHLLFTLHVYQYRVETARQGENTVAGGRSRLHIVDLGSCGRVKDTTAAAGAQSSNSAALSLSALGTVISALLSGQRQLPHRDSKLTQLMREALGGSLSHACVIVHVTPAATCHSETTQVVQLASRIQRTKVRRRVKAASSSDGSSCDGSSATSSSSLQLPHWYSGDRRRRAGVKMGVSSRRSAHSDPETSSCVSGLSGHSCDTVIHVGHSGAGSRRSHHSDRDYTDSETGSSVITAISAKSSVSCTSRTSSERRTQLQHLARSRRHARSSALPIYHPATIVEHPDEEQWIDGPRSAATPAVDNSSKSVPVPLDGSTRRSSVSRSRHQPPVLASNELWVDGPAEFQTLPAQQPSANIPAAGDESRSRKDRTDIPSVTVNTSSANNTLNSGKCRVEHSMVSSIAPCATSSMTADVKKIGQASSLSNNRITLTGAERSLNTARVSAEKTSSHKQPGSSGSSPHLPRAQPRSSLPPPDGRVAAWVQSVREAAITSGTLSKSDMEPCRELCVPDGNEASTTADDTTACSAEETGLGINTLAESDETVDADRKDVSPPYNDEDDGEKSSSDAAGSGHSIYEKNVDDCLETGSQAAVASSDEDAAWDATASSMHPAVDASPNDNLSMCPVEQFFDALEACPKSSVDHCNTSLSNRLTPNTFLHVRRTEVHVAHVVSSVQKVHRDVSPLPRRAFSTPRHVTSTPKTTRSKSSSLLVARGCAPGVVQDHASSDRNVPSSKSSSTRSSSADRSHRKSATVGRLPQGRQSSSSCASPRLSSAREDQRSRLPVTRSNTPLSTQLHDPSGISVCSSSSAKVRLLSPYHAVTSPRRVRPTAHSDSSSLLSDPVTVTSSGYESMLRGDDSDDVTADNSSLTNQSVASDCCSETRIVGRRIKEITSAALSSSSLVNSPEVATVQPTTGLSIWTQVKAERRHTTRDKDQPQIDSKDADKTDRTKSSLEAEAMAALKRIQRVDELLERRRSLTCDLAAVKELLGVGTRNQSSSDDHIESGRDRSDATYLQQLESETVAMERHLRAYQSRIMMVTCFDSQCAV